LRSLSAGLGGCVTSNDLIYVKPGADRRIDPRRPAASFRDLLHEIEIASGRSLSRRGFSYRRNGLLYVPTKAPMNETAALMDTAMVVNKNF